MNKEQEPRTRSSVEEELAQFERTIKELDSLKFRKPNSNSPHLVVYTIENNSYEITLVADRRREDFDTPDLNIDIFRRFTMRIRAKETGNVHSYEGPIVERIFDYVQESSRARFLQDATSKIK